MGSGQEQGRAGRQPVIGIVGLGAVGVALGRALQRVKTSYELVGHDRDATKTRAALGAGAVDRGEWSVVALASDADLLFLCEPLDELLETLSIVAPEMRPGTLLTDTASVKAPVLRRAREVVPAGVSFIGGHPVLRKVDEGGGPLVGAAYCLVPAPNAAADAVRVLDSLVEAVGAKPFFIDAEEHDALAVGVVVLPYLLSATLLGAVEASPSLPDLRRMAGPGFAEALAPMEHAPAEYRAALVADPGAALAWLDRVLAAMSALRATIARRDEAGLGRLLAEAESARERWLAGEAPSAAAGAFQELDQMSPLRDMLFGRRRPSPPREG
jgi:prephenate dehydrogenase